MRKFTHLKWCPHCQNYGLAYDLTAEKCPLCGQSLVTMAYPKCLHCGYDLHPQDTHCPGCNLHRGAALKEFDIPLIIPSAIEHWPEPTRQEL